MPRYAITEKAGRFVAGQTNNGAGTVLELTEKQAEHELRLGTLVPFDDEDAPEASPEGAEKPAPKKKGATPPEDKKAAPASSDEAGKGDGNKG